MDSNGREEVIEKKKIIEYLEKKRSIVQFEIARETSNEKKALLYAMLGVIDTIMDDLKSGVLDIEN